MSLGNKLKNRPL